MIRLGLKLTHDGGLALLDGTTLVFSHEAEKSANLARHAALGTIDVAETLARYGCSLADVDRVIVDGWREARAPAAQGATTVTVPVAPYHESATHRDPLAPLQFTGLPLAGRSIDYRSYVHAAGHACGTYATSPWAPAGRSALILVWDGAMLPRLYSFDPRASALIPQRPLFGFVGHVYPVFASHFGPFVPRDGRPSRNVLPTETLLDLSGKVMAWVGLGEVDEDLIDLFERTYAETLDLRWEYAFDFARLVEKLGAMGARNEDVLASFQEYLPQARQQLGQDLSTIRRCHDGFASPAAARSTSHGTPRFVRAGSSTTYGCRPFRTTPARRWDRLSPTSCTPGRGRPSTGTSIAARRLPARTRHRDGPACRAAFPAWRSSSTSEGSRSSSCTAAPSSDHERSATAACSVALRGERPSSC